MIGDIFWGCISFGNMVLGDPIGALSDMSDDAKYYAKMREDLKPENQLAKKKLYLFEQVEYYDSQLAWAKAHNLESMINLYQQRLNEYKEKLNLLK